MSFLLLRQIKAVSKAKGPKAVKALMKENPTFPELKIRNSSPSKCIPIDGDGTPTLTQAPRTAKRKLDLPASPSRETIRGAHTDESEVEDPMADTYASESSRSSGTYSLEYVTQVNYSSPPRRARTNRQRVRHHHPYSPPSAASTPEVEAARVLFGMAYIEYI